MSLEQTQGQTFGTDDFLSQALSLDTEEIVVKAEDLENDGSGINYDSIFFEPQPNCSYTLKFLPTPGMKSINHRKIYKKLPDPTRKGKRFHYVSSGSSKTCAVLDTFFKLNEMKKEGNAQAEKIIKEYMSQVNQGACIVEILSTSSSDEKQKALVGQFRIFVFSTYGVNATVANLLNTATNPTPEQMKNGFEKEPVFDIFESPIMILECGEQELDGQKLRDYSKSTWAKKYRGTIVKMDDGTEYVFSKKSIVDGKLAPDAVEPFKKLTEILTSPNLSVHNYFCYKEIDDPKNTPETNDYLKKLKEKVDEIVPVLLTADFTKVSNYGKVDAASGKAAAAPTADSANTVINDGAAELANSIMAGAETIQPEQTENIKTDVDIDSIIGD